MRDFYKSSKYFADKIEHIENRIFLRINKVENNVIKEDRLPSVKHSISLQYLSLIKLKYSLGKDMFADDVKNNLIKICEIKEDLWSVNNINVLTYGNDRTMLNQYTKQGFFQFLDFLSLGYLINIPNKYFNKLVNFIDKDNVKDYLYEFIIKAKIPNRPVLLQDNFKEFSWYKYPIDKLRDIIKMESKEVAQKHLKDFLDKHWYKSLEGLKGHNDHNKENGNYEGYWCFVAAAIVKIKGLDDSSFRDNKYYPKDLI